MDLIMMYYVDVTLALTGMWSIVCYSIMHKTVQSELSKNNKTKVFKALKAKGSSKPILLDY